MAAARLCGNRLILTVLIRDQDAGQGGVGERGGEQVGLGIDGIDQAGGNRLVVQLIQLGAFLYRHELAGDHDLGRHLIGDFLAVEDNREDLADRDILKAVFTLRIEEYGAIMRQMRWDRPVRRF